MWVLNEEIQISTSVPLECTESSGQLLSKLCFENVVGNYRNHKTGEMAHRFWIKIHIVLQEYFLENYVIQDLTEN